MNPLAASDLFSASVSRFGQSLAETPDGCSRKDRFELERMTLLTVGLIETADRLIGQWRDSVKSGVLTFTARDRDQYAKWIEDLVRIFGALMARRNRIETATGDRVAHTQDVQRCEIVIARLQKDVAEVGPPSFEEVDLTADEAAELDALIAAPPGSPGKLTFATKPIPLGDASLLR